MSPISKRMRSNNWISGEEDWFSLEIYYSFPLWAEITYVFHFYTCMILTSNNSWVSRNDTTYFYVFAALKSNLKGLVFQMVFKRLSFKWLFFNDSCRRCNWWIFPYNLKTHFICRCSVLTGGLELRSHIIIILSGFKPRFHGICSSFIIGFLILIC